MKQGIDRPSWPPPEFGPWRVAWNVSGNLLAGVVIVLMMLGIAPLYSERGLWGHLATIAAYLVCAVLAVVHLSVPWGWLQYLASRRGGDER